MESLEAADKSSAADTDVALRPTYAPIAMAMGIAMSMWGLMGLSLNINAICFMTIAGIFLSTWALKSWIGEIVLHWEKKR